MRGTRNRPEIVLLPGMDGTGRLFAPLLEALDPSWPRRVVAYPAGPATLDDLTSGARAAIPRGPHVLVAESFSGPIAVTLASERPPGLAGVALVSTFLRAPVPARPLARWLASMLPPLVPFAVAARLLLGPRAPTTLRDALRDAMRSLDAEAWSARLGALLHADARPTASGVHVPVLALWGRGDRLVRSRARRELLAALPAARAIEIDGPHLLLQSRPAQCAAILDEFVAPS